MSACIRIAATVLVYLNLLTVYPQLPKRSDAPQPSQLYQVSTTDKQSGMKKFGFIDNTGKLVIGFDRLPARTAVGYFSEGLASICFRSDTGDSCRGMGFIDVTGKVVIAPRFKRARQFSEGLAYVETEGLAGFIDHRGEFVIELKPGEGAYEFHEGLAAVSVGKGRGFIDRSGKFVTTELYTRVENFSEGLAAVAVGSAWRRDVKYGFINKEGVVVISLRFAAPLEGEGGIGDLGRFADGLARVDVGNRSYGYIDRKGDFAIPPRFRDASDFSEGLASVTSQSGETGYIDKLGRWAIVLQSAAGYDFNEGLAPVAFQTRDGVKIGFIDHTGRIVIKPRFDRAQGFVDGVATVSFEDVEVTASGRFQRVRYGYIDRTGKYLWKSQ